MRTGKIPASIDRKYCIVVNKKGSLSRAVDKITEKPIFDEHWHWQRILLLYLLLSAIIKSQGYISSLFHILVFREIIKLEGMQLR